MGVPVRIHVLLLLFIVLIFGMDARYQGPGDFVYWTGMATTFVLILSILAHELAHVFALTNLGGHVNSLVLTPWGGNSDYSLPALNRDRAIVHLAGPFVSGMLFVFGAMILLQTNSAKLSNLMNPFSPHSFRPSDWEVSLLTIATWVNFQLFIVNMIPCFPFDFGKVLRTVVTSINSNLPKVRTETTIMVIGHAVALAMIFASWIFSDTRMGPFRPSWLLIVSGITLLFAARYSFYMQTATSEEWDEVDEMEYDSLYDENSFFDFPDEEAETYSQWLTEKLENRREEQQSRIEENEDVRADEILKKLHSEGIGSITEEEKSLLNRVSARLRKQREQGV